MGECIDGQLPNYLTLSRVKSIQFFKYVAVGNALVKEGILCFQELTSLSVSDLKVSF